ncbi:hypothetical protein T265_16287 [Opisthorchis viverrini]|uniref:Uncharacterized protein n=1 Tax=Opisthorchis viverrini TaxID=6198 RepID=A0A074YTQ5_OPIVI|nr:hypothetical protein T265_16287 [Opisthorchis viverrini]KER18108.1 hypothetical protein T265_16287 [Opisthorchis viverrini]
MRDESGMQFKSLTEFRRPQDKAVDERAHLIDGQPNSGYFYSLTSLPPNLVTSVWLIVAVTP